MNENQELLVTKEVFSTSNQRVALQTRLILGGEALNPEKRDLPKIKPEQLTGIAVETYSKLKNASTNERDDYWQEKTSENESIKNYDQQMAGWVKGVTKYVNNPKVEQRRQTLARLKFDVNWQEFNQAEANKLYQRYFGAADTTSNVIKFVEDVLASYTENEKINFEKINQDLPEIKKLANIFGENSGELLEAVIQANAKLVTPEKKQELVDQVNESKTIADSLTLRVNWLNEDEEKLLAWLEQNSLLEKTTQPLPVDRKHKKDIVITTEDLKSIEQQSPLIQIQEELREKREEEMSDEEILEQINIEEPALQIPLEDMIAADPEARAETLTYESNKTYFEAWLNMVREKINKEGSMDRLGKFIILPEDGEFDNAQIQIRDSADFQVFSASTLANRYGLPWVGVRSGETNTGGHETLLLKVLKKEVIDNKPQLTLLVYDPMTGDKKEPIVKTIIKTGKPEEQGGKINWNDSTTWDYFDIIVTPQSLKMLANDSYDLTIGSDPLMMSSEYVKRLKTSAYQTGEANNCIM